jgi:hypothetical protein
MRKHLALAFGALLVSTAMAPSHAAGVPPMPGLTSYRSGAPIIEARWGHGHHYGWRHQGWRHHRGWGYYRGWGPQPHYSYYGGWGPRPYYGGWQPRPYYGYGYGDWGDY